MVIMMIHEFIFIDNLLTGNKLHVNKGNIIQ